MSRVVKKYSWHVDAGCMVEEADGPYVESEDYAALEAELERRKQLDQEALEFRQELIRERDEARAELEAFKALHSGEYGLPSDGWPVYHKRKMTTVRDMMRGLRERYLKKEAWLKAQLVGQVLVGYFVQVYEEDPSVVERVDDSCADDEGVFPLYRTVEPAGVKADDSDIERWRALTLERPEGPWEIGCGGSFDRQRVKPISDDLLEELALWLRMGYTPWNGGSLPLRATDRQFMYLLYYSVHGLVARMRSAEREAYGLAAETAAQQELIEQLRAELDAIKAQKPLAWLNLEKLRAGSMAYATTMQATARQSPIWALPPAGVEGLLKALDNIAFRAECFAEEERDMQPHSCEVVAGIARDAIAAWVKLQGLGGAVQKSATDTEPNRIPAGFYRELAALRELRDAVKLYSERYMKDEIESEESCVCPEQHDSACTVSDLLDKAFANHWNKTEAAGKAESEACEK